MGVSSKGIIAVTGVDLVPPQVFSYLEGRGYEIRHAATDDLSEAELEQLLDGARGYLIGGAEHATSGVFERAGGLEAVAFTGSDYRAAVPGWRTAQELGVAVIRVPAANASSVAELTIGLLLALSRSMATSFHGVEGAAASRNPPGMELNGKRLGIIGLGHIGRKVARAAGAGLGMEVSYTGPTRQVALERELRLAYRPKGELLAACEVISLHRPAGEPGEPPELALEEFRRMREGCLLVNTAHPGLVDPEALLWAAREKGVRAACEGLPGGERGERLLALGPRRFLAVPPMGYNTLEANLRVSRQAAEALCDTLDGVPHGLVVNPDHRAVRARRS